MQLRYFLTTLVLTAAVSLQAQNTSPYWSLSGNSNATTSSKLGTTNAINLRLFTNNVERLRILSSNGYVGIGTTAPTDRLHINSASGTNAFRAQVNGSTKLLVHSGGGLAIGGNATPPANGLYVAGNTGIGTATPRAKLHVLAGSAGSGATYSHGPLIVENSFDAYLNFIAPGTAETGILFGKTGSYGDGAITYNNPSTPNALQFRTNGGTTHMVLTSAGNLGIGTTIPKYALDVTSPTSSNTINVNNTFSGNENRAAINAISVNAPGWGYGIKAYGGYSGVYGIGSGGSSAGFAYGVIGHASGTADVGDRYGVHGTGYGGASAFGVFGSASGATSFNAAGYFSGAVYANSYNSTSDRKFKQDIQAVVNGLEQVLKLKPTTYTFKTSEYKGMHLPEGKQLGLIADEVKEVFPELVSKAVHPAEYDKDDRTKIITSEVKYEGVNYQGLIPVLIASIQEQQKQIEELKQLVNKLTSGQTINTVTSTGILERNTPNPVSGMTTIRYRVPQTLNTARLSITNAKGQLIKAISISNRGAGQVNLDTTTLAAGTYNYTLYVDGKQADSKRFIIAR